MHAMSSQAQAASYMPRPPCYAAVAAAALAHQGHAAHPTLSPLRCLPVAATQGHLKAVLSIAFNPDASLIATGSDDATVRIWDKTGACIATLEVRRLWRAQARACDSRRRFLGGVSFIHASSFFTAAHRLSVANIQSL